MNLFAGFANPFAMSSAPSSSTSTEWSSSVASASTSSSLSPAPSSASSQSSFASCDSHLQPPFTTASPERPDFSDRGDDEDDEDEDEDNERGDADFDSVSVPIRFPPSAASAIAPPALSPVVPSSGTFEDETAAARGGQGHGQDEVMTAPLSPAQNSFAQAQAAMAANNSSHSQNLIGHVLDASTAHHTSHLEFVSVLGLGAYGVVYLARDIAAQPTPWSTSQAHPQLGNLPLYAVKCLNKVGLDSRQRSFQRREIALHGLASAHPNVVTLHHVIEEETCIYVVLQFCEDGDLFGMITERQRYLGDDEMIRRVFLQILDAVDFCHQNSIYHRDLKPENILCLDDGERVVLADFGLATHERTSGDFGCGSTFYMSPECQGGLFQRLSTYSTPHNDIWSLGVILVNLTCGRNPWKQACPSDETFCAYLGNPDFLRSILPISDHTNRILKRIFALNPQARISLAELRREIMAVRRFTMTQEELAHATRATREAAKAFAASGKAPRAEQAAPAPAPTPQQQRREPSNVVYVDDSDDDMDADLAQEAYPEEQVLPPVSSWSHTVDESQFATPTQPSRKTPLTPPATPRRSTRSAHSPADPARRTSPTPRRRRAEVPLTPPSQSRPTFESLAAGEAVPDAKHDHVQVPPTPVTPTQRRRASPTRTSPTPSRRSPRSMNRPSPVSSSARRRKNSMDSSSSSSGHSSSLSQPATPTTAHYPNHYANKVRIAGEDSPSTILRSRSAELDAELHLQPSASNSSTLSVGTKAAYTAYYPIWSDDWADACRNQQADYHVELPPPVVLPAEMDDHDEYEFPMPPIPTDAAVGYYTRVPAGTR
ncbi:hypothetical protein JCM10908_002343 [Rhodotorula pacifica]|uniref:uncharacterized protein n=1 Tax=Rhodotorula pacifica TaxID=1495444 RepID=UPI0031767256